MLIELHGETKPFCIESRHIVGVHEDEEGTMVDAGRFRYIVQDSVSDVMKLLSLSKALDTWAKVYATGTATEKREADAPLYKAWKDCHE